MVMPWKRREVIIRHRKLCCMKWKVECCATPDGWKHQLYYGFCVCVRMAVAFSGYRGGPLVECFFSFLKPGEPSSLGSLLWRDTRNKKACHKLMCWESQMGEHFLFRLSPKSPMYLPASETVVIPKSLLPWSCFSSGLLFLLRERTS